MSQMPVLPHIYYTITELSSINDIASLKSLNVKTIGYVRDEQAYEIDFEKGKFEKSDKQIQLDLRHIREQIFEIKPYIIFGVLYSKNQCLALCVKCLKQFDADLENLVVYHHQLLEIRKKSIHFDDFIGSVTVNETTSKELLRT